ncbi:MAG: TspO/MBR family protein [Candidatus Paceibacterota bacterium]
MGFCYNGFMNEFRLFYESLTLPSFAPAPEVFGIAWAIVYPLIIIAGVYILVQAIRGRVSPWLFGIFVVNLFFNLLFTPLELEFGLFVGAIDILLVLGTLVYLEVKLWHKLPLAFWLLVPYLLWGAFATVLQLAILFLN